MKYVFQEGQYNCFIVWLCSYRGIVIKFFHLWPDQKTYSKMLYYTYFTWHRGRHTRIFAPKCHDSSGVLYRPMSSDITLQDFPFTEGQIVRNCRLRKQEITHQNGLRTNLFYLQMPFFKCSLFTNQWKMYCKESIDAC